MNILIYFCNLITVDQWTLNFDEEVQDAVW